MEQQPIKIILAGVPEQVNIPINLCIEHGIFASYGIDVEFRIVPEGTGRMLDLLEADVNNGEFAHIALCVTDAFIAGKAKGRKVSLCGVYTTSPLCWAVATSGTNSSLSTIDDLKQLPCCNIGISRLGSGSHSMAYYLGLKHDIPTEQIEFKVANNFQGLCDGVKQEAFDIFLWETFTTKPWFDNGELKKVSIILLYHFFKNDI